MAVKKKGKRSADRGATFFQKELINIYTIVMEVLPVLVTD